jgi:hypothetical protein
MAKVTRREDEIVLALDGEWELVERAYGSVGGWRNLKLYRHAKRRDVRKRTWFLSWNGERFARSSDCGILANHYPDRLEWVQREMGGENGQG